MPCPAGERRELKHNTPQSLRPSHATDTGSAMRASMDGFYYCVIFELFLCLEYNRYDNRYDNLVLLRGA